MLLDQAVRPLTEREFRQFQAWIHREAGIYLSEVKQPLLVGRLTRRVRELGLESFGQYFEYATGGNHPEERTELLNRICTHETHFFREPRQFEFLERTLIPGWLAEGVANSRPRRLRVWSAGCSSGEEPYSLAMSLLAHLPDWDVEVLATDLSTKILARAREAVWPIAKAAEIPEDYRRRFMLRGRGEQEGRMRAGREIRDVVRFQVLNLHADHYAVPGAFDLILCRNVLIYFDAPSRERVARRLLSLLAPNGFLFLGHAESLNALPDRPRSIIPTVYSNSSPSYVMEKV